MYFVDMIATNMPEKKMTLCMIIIQDHEKHTETTCHANIFLATQQRSILQNLRNSLNKSILKFSGMVFD